jgi:rubredoxin
MQGNSLFHSFSKEVETMADMAKYQCACGYVYDPAAGDDNAHIPAGTSFDDLPDNWVCPICGLGKDGFVKM